MRINLREDSVQIEGYVNAVERNSKPLYSRTGRFIERICKGAFNSALGKNDNVVALLNHRRDRQIGSQAEGNLKLDEDNIGLHVTLESTDPEVIRDAREGNLVGWSFGYTDTPNGVEQRTEDGMPLRLVRDMNLAEVSLLNRERTPAYEGTLVNVRSEDEVEFLGEELIEEPEITEEQSEEITRDEPNESTQEETSVEIDYSSYENMIKDMKED